ncbi:hypothetical protein MMC25_003508 [Agyrium rufum]|nr:hypothetical protein [Agyrium rufum]
MMARPIAGVRRNTLIITLPGSPKGAKENLQAIIKLLPHACTQAAGTVDSRTLHAGGMKKLEQEADVSTSSPTTKGANVPATQGHSHSHSHSHDHSHDHNHGHGHRVPKAHTTAADRPPISNDPSAGPSQRHRSSPYPLISMSRALSLVAQHTPSPRTKTVPVDPSLVSFILAEDVTASDPVPAFRASIVDGYAVKIDSSAPEKTKGCFTVASVSHAKPGEIPPLEEGTITRITTGAPLPPGADAVVMVEDTMLVQTSASGTEEARVEILTAEIEAGENVREVGSDVAKGDVILRKGDEISAVGGEIGLLASVGRREVRVFTKPVVGILSTGDEIVAHDREGELRLGEVRDSNRPALTAAVRSWGYEVLDFGIAKDTPTSLEALLRAALLRVDVLITTGGVSMGELDLLKPTIERALGGTIHFGRVSMKPGKPTTFATIPGVNIKDPVTGDRGEGGSQERGGRDKLMFSLSGNPASALVTAQLFVKPCLRRWSGAFSNSTVPSSSPHKTEDGAGSNNDNDGDRDVYAGLEMVRMRLSDSFKRSKDREEWVRMTVNVDAQGSLWATRTGGQRSSRVGSLKGANALVMIEAGDGSVAKGDVVSGITVDFL